MEDFTDKRDDLFTIYPNPMSVARYGPRGDLFGMNPKFSKRMMITERFIYASELGRPHKTTVSRYLPDSNQNGSSLSGSCDIFGISVVKCKNIVSR